MTEPSQEDGLPEPSSHGPEAPSLPESVDPEVVELLEDLPEGSQRQVVQYMREVRMHQGPMPDPATLRAYAEIDQRLLDEVIDGAKDNRLHRYAMDKRWANTARLSLLLCALIMLVALGVAVYFGTEGHLWLAALFGAGGITPVAIAMLRGGGDWRGRGQTH